MGGSADYFPSQSPLSLALPHKGGWGEEMERAFLIQEGTSGNVNLAAVDELVLLGDPHGRAFEVDEMALVFDRDFHGALGFG